MTATQSGYRTGDRVRVNDPRYPGVWIVRSTTGRVNAVLDHEEGGRGLRAPYSVLLPEAAGETSATVTFEPYRAPLVQGTLVRVNPSASKIQREYQINGGDSSQLFVVVADKGERVNIVKLGGDSGRYWRVSPTSLTTVDVADVLK